MVNFRIIRGDVIKNGVIKDISNTKIVLNNIFNYRHGGVTLIHIPDTSGISTDKLEKLKRMSLFLSDLINELVLSKTRGDLIINILDKDNINISMKISELTIDYNFQTTKFEIINDVNHNLEKELDELLKVSVDKINTQNIIKNIIK